MDYVLASASPRRRQLLKEVIENFKVYPSQADERTDSTLTPEQTVLLLAEKKCEEVFSLFPESTVIGCDTVVVFGGEILGKPKDGQDAFNTLKRLSGNTHSVITGVCVKNKNKKLVKYDKTEVTFNELSDEFINSYVESGSPLDKAGSYGIQDGGIVKSYSGSYTNVVGLPVDLVRKMLQEVL